MSDSPVYATVSVAELVQIRMNVGLGEQDRVIQFEANIDKDAPQSDFDTVCDKLSRTADRLRARHLLPNFRRQLEDVEFKHNENLARKAEVNARLKVMDEARDAKVLELRQHLGDAISRARDEHVASGRRGEFKPGASVTSRIDAQINQIEEGRAKEHAEAEQMLATLDNEIKDGERMIYKHKVMIAEYEALAADGPAND